MLALTLPTLISVNFTKDTMYGLSFLNLLAVLSLLLLSLSTRAEEAGDLATSVRLAEFGIVKHTFKSVYKRDQRCPDKVKFYEKPVVIADIGHVSLSDIKEDGERCSGKYTSTFKVASGVKMKNGKLLLKSGFQTAYEGLLRNSLAQDTLLKWKSYDSLIVGFDDGYRTCGKSKHSNQTFWFFVREKTPIEIDVHTGTKLSFTNITLPKNVRTLFFTDGRKKLCVLVDKTTSRGKKVLIQKQSYGEAGQPGPGSNPSSLVLPLNSTDESAVQMDTNEGAYEYTPFNENPGNETATFPGSEPEGLSPLNPSPEIVASFEEQPSTCFPANAQVELESGEFIEMSQINIGDRVRTSPTTFSDVFMFTHRQTGVYFDFLRISTISNVSITLTPSHYIFSGQNLVAASSINVGDDLVLGDGTLSKVTSIESVVLHGLYNPHTLDGNIIVDGVLTSTYTTAVHPTLAHGTLSPLRFLRFLYTAGCALQVLNPISSTVGRNSCLLSRLIPGGDHILS